MKINLSVAQAKERFSSSNIFPPKSISVSATVDKYLAVFKNSDGNIKAETNITNQYFADENICIINY